MHNKWMNGWMNCCYVLFQNCTDKILIHDDSCWMNCHSHGQFCLRYADNAVRLCCVLHAGGNILTHCLDYCLNEK